MGEIITGVRQSILTEDAAIQRRMGYAKLEYAIHADAGANKVLMFASKATPDLLPSAHTTLFHAAFDNTSLRYLGQPRKICT